MALGFVMIFLILTDINCDISEQRVVTLFKRGRKAVIGSNSSDEEKAGKIQSDSSTILVNDPSRTINVAGEKPIPMTDVFSWRHLTYTINVSGNERRLLNDVNGYVAPGKLTALMGESGAGKV